MCEKVKSVCMIDLDGTLIDSSNRHYAVLKDVLDEFKINQNFDSSYFLTYKAEGRSTGQFCKECLGLDHDLVEKICVAWKQRIENAEYTCMDKLYDDSIEFLKWISSMYDEVILITARNREKQVMNQIRRFNLSQFFNDIYITSPINASCNKEQIVRNFVESNKVTIIGDTEAEYNISLTLGVVAFVLNRGFRNKKYWKTRKVESFDSLIAIKEAIVRRGLDNG